MARRTFTELIDAVQKKDFEPRADIVDMIIDWLNDAYMRIAREDLKCFETDSSFNTISATNKYVVNTVCPKYRKMISTYTTAGPIEWQDAVRFNDVIHGNAGEPGSPVGILEYNDNFYIYPTPDSIIIIYAKFYQVPDRLTGSTADLAKYFLIPAIYEELVVNYAKAVYDFREKDWAAVDRAKAEFEVELRKWRIRELETSRSQSHQIDSPLQSATLLRRRV